MHLAHLPGLTEGERPCARGRGWFLRLPAPTQLGVASAGWSQGGLCFALNQQLGDSVGRVGCTEGHSSPALCLL